MEPSERRQAVTDAATPSDEEIARRVADGEVALFELLMRRHNQRVYRTVRALVRDESEVEDVMQAAYLSAYAHLGQFDGRARFSTWLTRIAFNEALMRLRRDKKLTVLDGAAEESVMADANTRPSPEDAAAGRELLGFLERAIDELPDLYRTVFVLREVEGLSTADAAEVLDTSQDVVKTRLSRARDALRSRLAQLAGAQLETVFPFHAPRCDRVVARVLERLGAPSAG